MHPVQQSPGLTTAGVVVVAVVLSAGSSAQACPCSRGLSAVVPVVPVVVASACCQGRLSQGLGLHELDSTLGWQAAAQGTTPLGLLQTNLCCQHRSRGRCRCCQSRLLCLCTGARSAACLW